MSALPSDPGADLVAAEAARRRLTESLRLPSWFHSSIGAAVAVMDVALGYGIRGETGPQLLALVGSLALFFAVAAVQLVRFRHLNSVRVSGLWHRALMGATTRASLVSGAALAAAVWAGVTQQWWLVGLASLAGGIGYGVCSRLWWEDYLRDPASHAGGQSWATPLTVASLVFVGLLLLMFLR